MVIGCLGEQPTFGSALVAGSSHFVVLSYVETLTSSLESLFNGTVAAAVVVIMGIL